MEKKKEPLRYRPVAEAESEFWRQVVGLDKIIDAGCYIVQLKHGAGNDELPLPDCDQEHYIVGTLVVTDSGTGGPIQSNRVIGQVLTLTSRKEKETKVYSRTRVDDKWSEWRSLATTGMYDKISTTEELLSTVEELVAENTSTKRVEEEIKHSTVDISSLICTAGNVNVAITGSSMDREVVRSIEIPVATNDTAGVMSADILNSISVNAPLIENLVIAEKGQQNTNQHYDATDYIEIPNGIIDVSATGYIAGAAMLIAFYDASKTFINGYGNFGDATSTQYSAVHLEIPSNARYIRYSSSRIKDKTVVVWGNKAYNKNIEALLPISIEWIDGEFINRGGAIVSNGTWCRSDYLDVADIAGVTTKAYNRGAVLACAFYDADYNYISGIGDYGYSVMTAIHVNVAVPTDAKYMRVSTATANKDDTVFLVNGMRDISQQEVINSLSVNATADKVAIEGCSISGVEVTAVDIPAATTESAGVMTADMLNSISVNAPLIENIVILNSGKQSTNANYDATDFIEIPNGVIDVSASGYLAGAAMLIAFYDASKTFISGYGNFGDTTSKQYSVVHLEVPSNARYIRYSSNRKWAKTVVAWGNKAYNKGLGVLPIVTQTIPAQFYRKQSGDSLRILCFGSSWLTNTWWYLNKMTNAVGINATIKCYFSSSCPFSKWIDRFEGKAEDAGSDFRRFDSVNGSDWSVEYVTDATEFKNSFEEDWDVIVFQQGATSSTDWATFFEPYYQKLMSYVKRAAKPWTVICYNNTWTPKLGVSPTLTKEAQKEWQTLNNENCIKFTNAVGLSNFVIPCGSAVWALRNDSVITNSDDFVSVENNTATYSDNLHLKNGLPLYLTGLTLFRSIVTPFYGIDIDDIAWLPDENTQKNLSSGKSWMPIDSEQATRVKDMVRLAFSNRYGFYTL